jgi:hypothetical protein
MTNTALLNLVDNFESDGQLFVKGSRNTIKLFTVNGLRINIKSFKKPGFIKKIIYKYFRPSKAKRSFEFGNRLLENGFLTPKPIGFIEKFDVIGLKNSYFCCEHLEDCCTIGTIFMDKDFENREQILRRFAQFFYQMHEKGIEFLDNSLGNTLVKFENNKYNYYLVDLNRMRFNVKLNGFERMKNLSRLTLDRGVLTTIANEYSTLYSENSEQELYQILEDLTVKFHLNLARKRNLKKLKIFDLNNLDALNT